ncbi:MAG: hypothetical protein RLZZ543_815, partial [Bacteroidota bacterium]
DEQEINIQIEVTASKDYTGKISIPSLLAFLENTTRKEQPFPPISIEIKGKGKKTFDKPIAPTLTALATSTEKPSPKPTTSANPVKTQTTSATSNTDPKKPISTAQKTEVKKENPTDKKESAPVKKEGAVVKKEEPTSKKEPVASNNNPVKKENQVATKESPAITKEAPIKPTVPAAEKANSTSIAGQITFRIQVSALPSKGDKESIAKEFGVEGKDLREENHNSLFKYTYGEYPNLTEARKKMNTNPKMKGKAFITGYRNGQRIDLEEAIRLSKEK